MGPERGTHHVRRSPGDDHGGHQHAHKAIADPLAEAVPIRDACLLSWIVVWMEPLGRLSSWSAIPAAWP